MQAVVQEGTSQFVNQRLIHWMLGEPSTARTTQIHNSRKIIAKHSPAEMAATVLQKSSAQQIQITTLVGQAKARPSHAHTNRAASGLERLSLSTRTTCSAHSICNNYCFHPISQFKLTKHRALS
eukprot:GHVU01021639.1.p1 GENE.GHVU01021639.1~~GHVU01021639.1.p1  ORF type:complete len:124 (-),score=4.02 GHVU01021639.1:143-514(-)